MKLIIDLVLALKNVDIFSDIPEHIMADIAEIIEVVEFSKGERFIKKGEVGNCLYIVRRGKVRVHDGERVLATVTENNIVGELSLLAPVLRTADVTATEDIVLFKIDREYFLDLLFEEPEIMKGILNELVSRIIRLNAEMARQSSL